LPGESLEPGAAAIAKEGSFYTPIAGSREAGFKARPVFYGMKLAGLLAGGRMRTVALNAPQADATAYAADMQNGETRMVVINKDSSIDLPVRIASAHGVKLWRLEAPNLTATTGVALAAAPIDTVSPWAPKREEHIPSDGGFVTLNVTAASAIALFADRHLAS
jgi:hypothetical protein